MKSGASLNRGGSRQDYQTPMVLLDAIKRRLGIESFAIDLAASADNTAASRYFTSENNALEQNWTIAIGDGWGWMNPPFGKMEPWVEKCAAEGDEGTKIAVLLPASIGAKWWIRHVHNKAQVLILDGRVTFVGETDPFPKDCVIAIYADAYAPTYRVWDWKKQP